MAGLRLAVGTLTVLPVGEIGEIRRPVAAAAMLSAPLASLPLAAGCAVIVWGAGALSVPGLFAGALTLGFVALGSRGMHLDGLSDTLDGFAAGWSRERALEVMRRGDVGPLGAAGLVLVLLAQASAVASLSGFPAGWLMVAWAVCASRAACAVLTVRGLPAARPSGLGVAVADSVPAPAAAGLWVGLTILGAGLAVFAGWPWWQPVAGMAVAAAVVIWLARKASRVLGGVTGDIVGAGIEFSLLVLLGVLAIGSA